MKGLGPWLSWGSTCFAVYEVLGFVFPKQRKIKPLANGDRDAGLWAGEEVGQGEWELLGAV